MTATPIDPSETVHVSEALREIARLTDLTDSLQRPELSAAWREFLARSAESALCGALPPLAQPLPSA